MKAPKYQQIQNDLQKQIESGKFENGDRFYTEAQITKLYNVSSITAVRALNELANNGYIIREQGKGSFVSRSRKHTRTNFSDIEKFKLSHDHVTIISIEKEQDPRILNELNLSKSDSYFKIIRIRTDEDIPYMYQQSYIPEQFIKQNVDSDYYKSIYQKFKDDFDIHMTQENWIETNEIVFPTPDYIAQSLHLKSDEPCVLQIRKTSSKLSQQIYEYIETYKRWDYYKIEISSLV